MKIQTIIVEVAFASTRLQKVIKITIPADSTIADTIQLSGINQFFPEYDFTKLANGIFGKRIQNPQQHQVKPGDRIEIYRPLQLSPNQKRLERAKHNK